MDPLNFIWSKNKAELEYWVNNNKKNTPMNTEGQRKRPCGYADNRKESPWDAEEKAWKWPYTHLEQTK